MQKTIIHSILVTTGGAKLQFQIQLPRNVSKVLSVKVTTDAVPFGRDPIFEAGWLWLKIPDVRDVFYSEIVQIPFQMFGLESFAPIKPMTFAPFNFWTEGTKASPFTIEIDRKTTFIEGYYTDRLREYFISAMPYTVQIYLQIEEL